MKKMNKKGFTIVELVIVIAVIAILAAVMIPTFTGIVDKANQSAVLQEARNYYTEAYADDLMDGVKNGLNANRLPVTAPDGTYYADGDYALYDGNKWSAVYDEGTWGVVAGDAETAK